MMTVFACLFVCFHHPAGQASESANTLSDYLLHAVLSLLKKEVSEHGRHLTQYFHLFQMYANLGIAEVSCRHALAFGGRRPYSSMWCDAVFTGHR